MQIKFNSDTWELQRRPGQWVLVKPGVSISLYNNDSLEEFKESLKAMDKNIENLVNNSRQSQ